MNAFQTTVLGFLTAIAIATAPAASLCMTRPETCPMSESAVLAFNQVASSSSTSPEVTAWFEELLALNPTATWGIRGQEYYVVSGTNQEFVLPEGDVPSEITIKTV